MPALLLFGTYTPATWGAIRADPGVAPAAIGIGAAAAGGRLAGYWFAFDENDFYAIVEGDNAAGFALLRHRLMASGAFKELYGEPCLAPDELIGALQSGEATGGSR